jgi:diaminopimelate epimerase
MNRQAMTPPEPTGPPLRLTKHQAAGNDFLVTVDLDGRAVLGPALVRALCDRRFGVGADGVIRILAGSSGADLTMVLTNADGSTAEMSGNGMRCLAQAAVAEGLVRSPTFTVATPGGVRTVEFRAGELVDRASVDMGVAGLGPERTPAFSEQRGRLVDMGNPHLVLGTKLQGEFPDGINVEFVTLGPEPDAVTLRVWERGVGETLACGTGSAASAAVVHDWGLVGPTVDVHNPGGTLRVELAEGTVVLSGPVAFVARIEVDPARLIAGRTR